MSQTMRIEVSDELYERIRQRAAQAGVSPDQLASAELKRHFGASLCTPDAPTIWPDDFFEKIRIDDPTFKRPDQGPMPPCGVGDNAD